MTQNLTRHTPHQDEIDFLELIKILINSKKIIISTILVFAIASLIYSLSLQSSFESSFRIQIGDTLNGQGNKELIESSSSLLFAQGPKQARYLLEQVSKKIEKQKNMRFEFKYVLENNEEQIRQETEGKVTLAGDRYKLDFLEIIQLFDGEKIYTIVPENEEITVSTPEDSEEINVNPSQILNFYKEGYDYQWDIYQRVMGRNIQFIKLIPSEENADIKYLLLGIDVDQNSIYRLIEIGNGKTTTTLTIKNQEENITLPPYFFEFNVGDYPNYYLNN